MSDDRITVLVDVDLEELIPGFLENRARDVHILRQALAEKDYGKLQSVGHSLKGVGGGYGFDELSKIGAEIEAAAKAQNIDPVEAAIDRMANYLERIDVIFE